jgi:hypothetical protein
MGNQQVLIQIRGTLLDELDPFFVEVRTVGV